MEANLFINNITETREPVAETTQPHSTELSVDKLQVELATDSPSIAMSHKIEKCEVEGILLQSGSVKEAVVNIIEDADGNSHFIGCIVPLGNNKDGESLHLTVENNFPGRFLSCTFLYFDKLPERSLQIICLTGKDQEAVERQAADILTYLSGEVNCNIANLAYSLQPKDVTALNLYKQYFICSNKADVSFQLSQPLDGSSVISEGIDEIVFLFPGNAQFNDGSWEHLYANEPVFRFSVDECLEVIGDEQKSTVRQLLLNSTPTEKDTTKHASCAYTACFVAEYALAKMWMSWGIHPTALCGSRSGELVAGHLAGVFNLRDGLQIAAIIKKEKEEDLQHLPTVELNEPGVLLISSLSGNWITDAEATDVTYWAGIAYKDEKLKECVKTLIDNSFVLTLECGIGNQFSTLIGQYPTENKIQCIPCIDLISFPTQYHSLLTAVGELWRQGCHLDWEAFYIGQSQTVLELPSAIIDNPEKDSSQSKTPVVVNPTEHIEKYPQDTHAFFDGQAANVEVTDGSETFDAGKIVISSTVEPVLPTAIRVADSHVPFSQDEPVDQKTIVHNLVPIKATGKKAPLFIVGCFDLDVASFSTVTGFIDPEQPVYGVQLRMKHKMNEDDCSIENMAAEYLPALIAQNTGNAFYIAGYSFGSYVAIEIARQLKEKGKDVKLLAVIDAYVFEQDNETGNIRRKILRQLPKALFTLSSFIKNPTQKVEYQSFNFAERFKEVKGNNGENLSVPEATAICLKYEKAFSSFRLPVFDGTIELFKLKKRVYYSDDMTFNGWKPYAKKGVNINEIPGDYKTFMAYPNNIEFARILQKALDETNN